MNSRGLLLLGLLLSFSGLRLAAAEAEEKASLVDVATAATLLGSVGVIMMLFYLLNWPDPDIRKYSYEVICSTISIFCAVLLFQSFQQVVEAYLLDGKPFGFQIFINFVHNYFWHFILQVSIAFMSKSIGSTAATRKRTLQNPHELQEVRVNMKCFGVLLAHITGFSSINAWGFVQQTAFFRRSPLLSWLVVPMVMLVSVPLGKLTDAWRKSISLADGAIDKLEQEWSAEVAEAENDVSGLAISFLTMQSVRFAIFGHLPNIEGDIPAAVLFNVTYISCLALYMFGLFCTSIFAYFVYIGKVKNMEKHHSLVDEEEEKALERHIEVMVVAFAMGSAWSFFYATRSFLATAGDWNGQTTLLTLVLAILVSVVCFSAIYVLDKLADLERTGKITDMVIVRLVSSIAILVGFAWEQNFKAAVAALASHTSSPVVMKLVLGILCAILVVPAWRHYMLPMVVHQGWRYGFLAHMAMQRFDPTDKKAVRHYLELLKHFATFGDHAVRPPALDSDDESGDEDERRHHVQQGGQIPRLLQKKGLSEEERHKLLMVASRILEQALHGHACRVPNAKGEISRLEDVPYTKMK